MGVDFQTMLEQIRAISDTEVEKGRTFERVMREYFREDPVYSDRFSDVWRWSDWAARHHGFSGKDTGIDLVAQERAGDGYCAVQCKCYAPGTRIAKPHLDSFIAASSRDPFTARIVVDTGDDWGPNATDAILGLKPECQVLRFGDLAAYGFDWPDLVRDEPEDLRRRGERFCLRPHQREALDGVLAGFQKGDRGKLIMACGTGKTFTALRIAEEVAGRGGRVLYLVPSIALFAQSMREWAEQRRLPHRYVGVCSDASAGKKTTKKGDVVEDALLEELEIPPTTDPERIAASLRETPQDALTAVFCTYHSLPLVAAAQEGGAPAFDLILCDEAHRTTGVERPGEEKTSPFVLVHDEERIRAEKRLYMTATPRLYTESAKARAKSRDVEVFSMDDENTYGPEFHRLPFSRAVEQKLLSDFKVVVLTLSEEGAGEALQGLGKTGRSEITITDQTKIVGCWRALQNPESGAGGKAGPVGPLRRAIAFTNTIKGSQRLNDHWSDVVAQAVERLPAEERAGALRCETEHVDGKNNALQRKGRIDWLREEDEGEGACRILSNARCLSEGVDVPALDAVLFMEKRKSHVDIVQAVGRAMRKAEGKEYGYIILPVAIPPGADPVRALDRNAQFEVVWQVLNALRAHDERFNAEINQIDLNENRSDRIIFGGGDDSEFGGDESEQPLPFPPVDVPPGAIYAKIVERCGDRRYWESWAKDVADIFARLVARIECLLETPGNEFLCEWFGAFHKALRESINESITRQSAVDMMAQHILTRPVFEALFEGYDFAAGNPVSQALDNLREDFAEFGLEGELREMKPFYESVRNRARGLDNAEARQRVLMELYENFFRTAMRKEAEKLGIVYTPTEIVDFLLHSADHVLRAEFGRSLSDAGVRVLDPFTGTGVFLVRLLQSGLIREEDLTRKYRDELHANEIVLLAYYIAAIHIEEAFHGRMGAGAAYEPFRGVVLTDTFNLHTERTGFPKDWLPDNSARVERQQQAQIQVIVGNPPWSAGQKSAADDNQNVFYPEMSERIRQTYAARSDATLKKYLYDSYKMAIRWASDRIGKKEGGVVAFVTNGSWIDGNGDSGVRACLAEEFDKIYVLNLRGNLHTQGEVSKREGGNVFDVRVPVAITILVRRPLSKQASKQANPPLYHNIGDYLKREEKLAILREAGSIAGIEDWREIAPDRHHDWIGQRAEAYQALLPMGTKKAKARRADDAIFRLFSLGYATGRDAYIYNFSRTACAENARRMVGDYAAALRELERTGGDAEEIARRHAAHVRWDENLRNNLRQGKTAAAYAPGRVWRTQYRPFVKQHCYVDYVLVHRKYRQDSIFPDAGSANRAICVSGKSAKTPFSALMVDAMPDLHFMAFGQCFPRWRYQAPEDAQGALPGTEKRLERVDNISDAALRKFRAHYADNRISKDDVFDYVYGVLHAPDFRARFANDLAKELPRAPLAPDFRAFADAGRALAALHLGYETCAEYPLEVVFTGRGEARPAHYRIGKQMRFADKEERTTLVVNDHIRLRGVPAEAHRYAVNGRTPLEWLVDRYRFRKDKESGIANDPNGWFDDPRDLIAALRRAVHLGVETARVIDALPPALAPE